MTSSIARSLDALAEWRRALDRGVDQFERFLADHELLDAQASAQVDAIHRQLGSDQLVLAFVAEFSRGKSELINAIFFSDAGRRVLPATPGRTTMCPVELAWDPQEPPGLSLLPIDTRLRGQPLADLREKPDAWRRVTLPVEDAESLSAALAEVKRTVRVPVADARLLGFWDDEHPADNPPQDSEGKVEVPAWRHALINYPHPLLKRGLVVLDTPGLNAIGAEPELTLGLLPSAHATVFVLGADTGVTKSDLAIWRDHLGGRTVERFVVLNKIDALVDPLSSADEVRAQIEQQCEQVARTLEVPRERVFPLSAREALAGRVGGDPALVATSRLPALEEALSAQLLPQRGAVIARIVREGADRLQAHVQQRLGDQRRQVTEQLLELRDLRGKSGAKVGMMLGRVKQDAADFETCVERLVALKAVHARQLRSIMLLLSSDRLRREVALMRRDADASWFRLGARKAFTALGARLADTLTLAAARTAEIEQMLAGSFRQLNADYGFALATSAPPTLERFVQDLRLIQDSYVRYLGAGNALRLAEPSFLDNFLRMLVSKLRVVFENASAEIEMWNKTASSQIDTQLRDRRRAFKRRTESLERIQSAANELESRLGEVETQDQRLARWQARAAEHAAALRVLAEAQPQAAGPAGAPAERGAPHLALVRNAGEAAAGGA
jgi:hypothetical protein